MYYLIFYDISDDRVRKHVSQYLETRACKRIQKSVFMLRGNPTKLADIERYLMDLQLSHQNEDSILIVPVPPKLLKQSIEIGENIAFQEASKVRNVAFF
ncbi:MAG: CRISPR-associated endonuclease Cas2 [Bernardetiaceae bacterium]|nr:CRISPR-associated endonuclease Cas2 [Bernardetiaceae bacterium]